VHPRFREVIDRHFHDRGADLDAAAADWAVPA
jgi:hypothetical protein